MSVAISDLALDRPAGPWCCEIELAGAGPADAVAPLRGHRTARVLARLHGVPLGYLSVPVTERGFDPEYARAAARLRFADGIAEHLAVEGRAARATGRLPPATADCPNAPLVDRSVTVVVCTRNRSSQLASCLDRLGGLTYPRLDVLVVDNAPADDATRRVVEQTAARDGRVAYVVEPRPGLSAARNRGLATATGDIVAYTDDDVWVDPGWVDGLVRGFRRRGDVGCTTGLVSTASISTPAEAYFDARAASWSARMAPDVFDLSPSHQRGPLYPYSAGIFGTGANLALDRRLLDALGGFDEALGAGTATNGGEDLDIFVRVLRAGRAIAYEPSALVWHHHRADDAALLRQMFGYGTGLSAFVTKCLMNPQTRPEVSRRVLQGVRRLHTIRGETRDRAVADVPRPAGAASRELLGLLAGPLRYRQARRVARADRQG